MLRRFAEYETLIFCAKRVLKIINGSLMKINVKKKREAQKYGIFGQIACVRPLLAQASVAALDFVACHSVAEGGEYL